MAQINHSNIVISADLLITCENPSNTNSHRALLQENHTHKINHTTKFTLHLFTVSHVIDNVTGLCDVISTLADNLISKKEPASRDSKT